MQTINVLVDNDSWITAHAQVLIRELEQRGYSVNYCRHHQQLTTGWITFLLGCTKLVPAKSLAKSRHNLVVHESDLPEGKGFAPMAWQILAGQTSITISLLEALPDAVDAGDIWLQRRLQLQGNELCSEWRQLQGQETVKLCLHAVDNYDHIEPQAQQGEESFYARRTPADSELDVDASLAAQFDLLRVVDNERYPAFFYYKGRKYCLTITADEDTDE